MASLSHALRLGDLPPPHRTLQGHATHIIEWSMMLRPNDSWSTCIPQGIATFLHYASRRSARSRYTTHNPQHLPALQSKRFHQKRNIRPCCHLLILQYFVCYEKPRRKPKDTL